MRDVIHDPGGAASSRVATMHMLPSVLRSTSASATFGLSRLNVHTPHGPCLRFEQGVATLPARLDPGLPATALTGRDLHP